MTTDKVDEARYVDIVFDWPPEPPESGRFVEVEDAAGASINLGQWVQRDDGYWVLRISPERGMRRAEPPLTDWPDRPRDAARHALKMLNIDPTEERVKVIADLYIEGRTRVG